MIKQILIQYDHIEDTITIKENDFGTFEALAVLETAKMIVVGVLDNEEGGWQPNEQKR